MRRALVVALIAMLAASAQAQDIQRGARNYKLLLDGKLRLESLPKDQQAEVLMVYRRVRATQLASHASQACRDAASAARDAAHELARRAKRLAVCAEAGDLDDDCDTEFRRVKRAHEDYESASSTQQSECR